MSDKFVNLNGLNHFKEKLEAIFGTKEELNSKQDILISGINIKTINSTTLLGSGNLNIVGSTIGYEEIIPNPYKEKILSVQKLYDVGETNLTDDDVVTVNGIDHYVLQVDSANNKAELITKGIYDTRFNSTNTGDQSEYNYVTADLKTWMENFYTNYLGSDEYILNTEVTSYYKASYSTNLTTFSTQKLNQHVFALDAIEAQTNASKFSWDNSNGYIDNPSTRANGFWVSAGFNYYGLSGAFSVFYVGSFNVDYVDYGGYGARPAFWISLED